MKKSLFLTGLCLMMSVALMAQGNQNNGQRQMRQMRQMDAVVDTAVINHMNLDAQVLEKVYKLQESKKAEQEAMMKESRPQKGQRMSDAERKAMQEKRETFTAKYRKELRELLGDETYILYLEKQVDRNSARQFMMRPMQNNRGQQGGGQRQGGGFGGNGGFGDDF